VNARVLSPVVAVLSAAVMSASAAAQVLLKESPYYPLKVGNRWEYKVEGGKLTVKVTKIEEIAGTQAAVVEVYDNDRLLSKEHVAVKDDGLYRLSFSDKVADPAVLFFKAAAAKGDKWDVASKIDGEELKASNTVDTAEVPVPAGSVAGKKVEPKPKAEAVAVTIDSTITGTKVVSTLYFVKDVGIAKQVLKVGDRDVVLELSDYELK
jgi:hypothetical protein